jgi:hypothetical protein
MTCAEFESLALSDDPAERAAAATHAADCTDCAERLRGWTRLAEMAAAWRSTPVEPSAALAARVRMLGSVPPAAAETGEAAGAPRRVGRVVDGAPARRGLRSRAARQLVAVAAASALAATLAMAVGVAWRSGQAPGTASGGLVAAEALREAEAAAEANARAIAKLEAAAQPFLLTANRPELSAEQAALLLSYQERLRFLDRTLAEIQGFLDENPYNARARTLLLAGTIEKREILRGVLELAASPTGGKAS